MEGAITPPHTLDGGCGVQPQAACGCLSSNTRAAAERARQGSGAGKGFVV